jgi:hypothetical protein
MVIEAKKPRFVCEIQFPLVENILYILVKEFLLTLSTDHGTFSVGSLRTPCTQ